MTTAAPKILTVKALLPGLLLLVCCHVSLGQNVRLSNTSTDVGKGRFKWTLFVDADDSVLRSIEYVVYNLHPAFDKPERKVDRPTVGPRAFSTSDVAFRPSKMYVLIYFKDGQTMRLEYTLRLRSSFARSWYVILGSSDLSQRDKVEALSSAYQGKGVSAYIINTNSGDFPNFDRGLWMLVSGPSTQTGALSFMRKTPSLGSRKPYVMQAARY